MLVTTTTYTIADYCRQMEDENVVVNKDYQRSSKVWPTAARSYLIDTILSGFPIPKLSLYHALGLAMLAVPTVVLGLFFTPVLRLAKG